ncbi:hypothetical protein SLA2020_285740 [Shorea laevis]
MSSWWPKHGSIRAHRIENRTCGFLDFEKLFYKPPDFSPIQDKAKKCSLRARDLQEPQYILHTLPLVRVRQCAPNRREMQSLQEKASQWSGVDSADAFAIDTTNLFQKLGLQTFINLSTNFYNRVYDDEEEWFRSIFASSKKEEAIQNQYEFFVQRMGGPPLYSQRKGHPALIGRHRPFPVTHQAAERWLHHMQKALESSPDIDDDSKTKMMNFFRHTAFFLVAGDELKNQNQQVLCKHAGSKPDAV